MMNDSKIIALIDGISEDKAIQLGSIGIDYIDANPTGNGIRFYLANGMQYDVPISTMNFMFKNLYDTNNNGNVDKADKLQLKDGSTTYNTGEELLNRANHTGTQKTETVTIENAPFKDVNRRFTGTTLKDFLAFVDTNKEFIDGIYIGDNTVDGSFKIQVMDSKLVFFRRENGTWNLIQKIGSIETDKISLNKESSEISFYEESDKRNVNVVCKSAITTNGLRFGDARLEDLFLTADNIKQIKYVNDTYYFIDIQTDYSETNTISTYSVDFIAPIQKDTSIVLLAADAITLSNSTTSESVGFVVTETDTGREIYRTASDFEIKQGLGIPLTTTGLYSLKLGTVLYFIAGRKYTIKVMSNKPITAVGKTINGSFIPYIDLAYKQCVYLPFVTRNDLTDSLTTNSSEKYASAKSVYLLNQAVQSVVAGKNPIIPTTFEDFATMKNGTNGSIYIFTNDGILFGQSYKKESVAIITNTFDYSTEVPSKTIQSTDCAIIAADTTPSGHIFITNIENVTNGKSVTKTMNDYPDDVTINSITTDESFKLKVTVIWDRGAEKWCGVPTINDVPVTNITHIAGGTFTGYANISMSGVTDKITAMYGTASYLVGVTKIVPPVINSFTFGSLPNGQTELKAGDLIDINITTDKSIDTVEIQNYGAFVNNTINVTAGTTISIKGTIADKGTTLQQLTGKIRVKSVDKSWSEATESIDTLPLNNIKPTISLINKVFSSGLSALKNNETCTVTVGTVNCDTLVSSAIGTELNVSAMSGSDCTVTRISGSYNDSTPNLRITGTRTANGAVSNLDVCVEIANVAPTMTTPIILKLSSGSGTQSEAITFNQKVKVQSITAPSTNLGNLVSSTTSSYDTLYNWQMSSSDSDTKSTTTLYINATIVNMAGLTTNLQLPYLLAGFSLRTLSLTYNALSVALPCAVVNSSNLVVSNAFINSSPPFQIMKRQVVYDNIGSETADAWAYNPSDGKVYLPSSVFTFGYNSSNGITFQIQETN